MPVSTLETRKILERIVRKAERLEQNTLVRQLADGSNELSFNFVPAIGSITVQYTPVPIEAIEAFLLNLRFFMLKSEPTSFLKLSETLALNPDLSQAWRDGFTALRAELNQFLAGAFGSERRMGFVFNNRHVTRGEILDTMMYGELAHANNVAHSERYKAWQEDFFVSPLTSYAFQDILMQLTELLSRLKVLTQQELTQQELEAA